MLYKNCFYNIEFVLMRIITPTQLDTKIHGNKYVAVIDVCDKDEFESQSIEGAINIPIALIGPDFEEKYPDIDLDDEIVVYSTNGKRSKEAAAILMKLGYRKVYSLEGGISNWYAQGYD